MNKDTGKRTKINRDGDREREESNNLIMASIILEPRSQDTSHTKENR